MTDSIPVISIENLKKSFGKVPVLDGINLTVKRGEMLALLGPNGAGKTTTVRILSTLLAPDDGDVRVNGFDVVKDADRVRRSIGLTGQYAAVDEFLSGRENLEMMGRLYHLDRTKSKGRAEELLEQFDLIDAADRPAKTYSGGMRRRLDLAASLVATPPVIFLDEPTTGLDPLMRQAFVDIIKEEHGKGKTIFMSSHMFEEVSDTCDRVALISDGHLIDSVSIADIVSSASARLCSCCSRTRTRTSVAWNPRSRPS